MKISIVTPSYNQGRFIARTIESVSMQRGVEIEHVVFDGGSTDNTVEVMQRLPRTFSWVSEPDRGQTHAVNKGIAATDGDIIGWLNSDDVYYPGAFSAVAAVFASRPDVDVVYGMADHIDEDDHPFEEYPTAEFSMQELRNRCFICQPAAFFRRSVVDKLGPLDESLNYCMDYEFWLRLGLAGAKFEYLPTKLAGSRMYGANKTLGSRVAVHKEINDMQKRLFKTVPDAWLYSYAHAVVEVGTDRTRSQRMFATKVGLASIWAALRWNHRVSRGMLRRVGSWWLSRSERR